MKLSASWVVRVVTRLPEQTSSIFSVMSRNLQSRSPPEVHGASVSDHGLKFGHLSGLRSRSRSG